MLTAASALCPWLEADSVEREARRSENSITRAVVHCWNHSSQQHSLSELHHPPPVDGQLGEKPSTSLV